MSKFISINNKGKRESLFQKLKNILIYLDESYEERKENTHVKSMTYKNIRIGRYGKF